jgi:hypothetical protein
MFMVSVMLGREIHTAEPRVPDPSRLDVEIGIGKLNKYKSPCIEWSNSGRNDSDGRSHIRVSNPQSH